MDQDDTVLPDAPAAEEQPQSDNEATPGSVQASAATHSDKENNNLEDMFDDDDDDEFTSSAPQSSLQQPAHGSMFVFISKSPEAE